MEPRGENTKLKFSHSTDVHFSLLRVAEGSAIQKLQSMYERTFETIYDQDNLSLGTGSMAYTRVTFDPVQQTDSFASGASGDNQLAAGGLIFSITAQGNWTADFSNSRFNFTEDPSFGGQNFTVNVTAANGGAIRYNDYLVSYNPTPDTYTIPQGTFSYSLNFMGTTIGDDQFNGGPFDYSVGFPGSTSNFSTTQAITEIQGNGQYPFSTFWFDDFSYETNVAPTITDLSRADDFVYVPGSGPVLLDHGTPATITDADASGWTGGQLRIGYASGRVSTEDRLLIIDQGNGAGQVGVSGSNVSYGGVVVGTFSGGTQTTGTLSINFNASATDAAVQAILRDVAYQNVGNAATTGDRLLTVTLRDALNATSTATNVKISVANPNQAPVAVASTGTTAATEQVAVVVDSQIALSDTDNTTLSQARVAITGNFHSGEDVLAFTNNSSSTYGNITASYSGSTGILTLTSADSTATVAQFRAALGAVTYTDTSDTPDTSNRTISFSAYDGTAYSTASTKIVSVAAVNDAPTLTATGLNPTFTEGSGAGVQGAAVALFSGAAISTIEAGQKITDVTFTVSGLKDGASETLTAPGGLVLSLTAGTGTANGLTYEVTVQDGTATVIMTSATGLSAAQAQALLNGLSYQNTNVDNPTVGDRTITLTSIKDNGGTADSGADTTSLSIASKVTVTAVNDAPALTDTKAVLAAGSEDTAYTVTKTQLLQGYTDAENDTLSVADLKADHGTVKDNGNDTYTITPQANYNGIVKLTYGVSDGTATTDATQSFELGAVNDAPTADHLTQSLTLAEDAAAAKLFTTAVTVDDVDSESVTATLTLSKAAAGVLTGATATAETGVYTITGSAADVEQALNAVKFESADDFNGSVNVMVAISDDNPDGTTGTQPSGKVSITVTEVNDTPTAGNDTLTDVAEGSGARTILASTLLANDGRGPANESSQTLKITAVGEAVGGAVALDDDGDVVFTPTANYNGPASFSYTVTDDGTTDGSPDPKSATATASFNVTAVNDAPSVSAPSPITVTEDVATAIKGFSFADIDAGSATVTATLSVASGSLAAASGSDVSVSGTPDALILSGTITAINDFITAGNVSYTTAKDATGPVTLNLSIDDNGASGSGGAKTGAGSTTINITPVNDPPVLARAIADQTLVEDRAWTFKVPAGTFADVDGDTLAYTATRADGTALPTWLSFDPATQTFSGTPPRDYNGTLSFKVTASDGTLSASDTFELRITPENDAPVATNDVAGVVQRSSVSGNVITAAPSDFDVEGNPLKVGAIRFDNSSVAVAAAGTTLAGDHGRLTIKADGSYSYNANVEGGVAVGDKATDVFTYTLSDGQGGTDTADLIVRVTGSDTGNAGANLFYLTGSGTKATGLGGDDIYQVDATSDQVVEAANGGTDLVKSSATYTLSANVENLTLLGSANANGTGNALANVIQGNGGNNTLAGGLGNDTLSGGGGDDVFLFNTTLAGNIDRILSYSVVDDTIALENAVFKALTKTGTLASGAFKDLAVKGAVVDADDRILYNSKTGALSYDADGSKTAVKAVQFAILDNHPTLTFQDFDVV